MKKVKNLTENKVLINTFKKFKLKNYLNKTFLKKNSFFLTKFKTNFKKQIVKFQATIPVSQKLVPLNVAGLKHLNYHTLYNKYKLFKSFLIFIKLYFFQNI